ncbi:MAG: UDP-N-acetylmuramate--L-alanine ligase [Planctomycetota bacterium]|jgi:UDP-N-acetylmuramate--alanine ligase
MLLQELPKLLLNNSGFNKISKNIWQINVMSSGIKGKKIHFMGAGGIGVSALAVLAKESGAIVSCCDRSENEMTENLKSLGMEVKIGHSSVHLSEVDILVHTSAVKNNNEELAVAQKKGVNILKRGDFLAQLLLNYNKVVGICGTHGKTTTTWLTGSLLRKLGAKPTIILGGIPQGETSNVFIGSRDLCVVELDESDGSFLNASVDLGVITNVDPDHLDYYGDAGEAVKAFRQFADNIQSDGELITCLECINSKEIFESYTGNKTGVGLNCLADLHAEIIESHGMQQSFAVNCCSEKFVYNIPGIHNLKNLLCALAVVGSCGFKLSDCSNYVSDLVSVERRFEMIGEVSGITLVSDYAHHPTEVLEAISTAFTMSGKRTVAVFQPHLFSRTKAFYLEFGRELAKADIVVLVDIYPAREEPEPGIDSNLIKNVVLGHNPAVFGPVPKEYLCEILKDIVIEGDKVIFMGAGDIGECPYEFMAELQGKD